LGVGTAVATAIAWGMTFSFLWDETLSVFTADFALPTGVVLDLYAFCLCLSIFLVGANDKD
jgi:hypothetical protein